MSESSIDNPAATKSGFSGKQVLLFLFIAMALTALVTFWVIRTYIVPADFKPVALSTSEQGALDTKLRQLGVDPKALMPQAKREEGAATVVRDGKQVDAFDAEGRLVPEAYTETPEKRNVRLNERELNALVASNPDMAKRLAIDLSNDLASAKLLIPVDPDMPMLGGKTLRVNAGVELSYREEQPVVRLRGISIMGVPMPNAWLGNLKNVDLVEQFGAGPGFWQGFAEGVEMLEISDGELHIKLKE